MELTASVAQQPDLALAERRAVEEVRARLLAIANGLRAPFASCAEVKRLADELSTVVEHLRLIASAGIERTGRTIAAGVANQPSPFVL
jgi:hypothetical protein